MPASRTYSFFDQLLFHVDQAIRTLHSAVPSARPNPAANLAESSLHKSEQRQAAGFLRVDHVGEICAQALYQGQAITARTPLIKKTLQQSAQEENDHLVWCYQRLQELHSHPSYLNLFWYFGALCLGMAAGALGDQWSMGFVAETEHQVVKHLDKHLMQLPPHDEKSRRILQQMRQDELHHATVATETGGVELPTPIKKMMRLMAKFMTTTAYWV